MPHVRPLASALAALALPAALVAHGIPHRRADAHAALHGEAEGPRIVLVEADPALLAREGFDLARHGGEAPGEPVHVVAGPRDLARLAELGLLVRPAPALRGRLDLLQDWSSLEQVNARIDALVAANPDIMGKKQIGTSVEGRPIYTVHVSSSPCVRDPAKPKVSINGNHHAREVMTVEAALDVLGQIAAGYRAGDAAALGWVAGLELYVTPVVNPDGYHTVMTDDSWWRKNRRVNANGSRGVDLNRNYPYAWGANDSGSSGNPHSETYRGPSAASEPEAQAMIGLAREIRPLFNLSYHSYGETLLYPYGYENAINPDGDVMEDLATGLAARMTQDDGSGSYDKRSRLYPVNGLDRDWYYFELGTYSFVPEISGRGFHPSYSWVQPTVTGLRAGWRYLLERALGEGLRGRVVDAGTGAALAATVRVAEVQWHNGESHGTDVDGGFSKLLAAGTYQLEVSAEGYQPASLAVTVVPGQLARVEVALAPVAAR